MRTWNYDHHRSELAVAAAAALAVLTACSTPAAGQNPVTPASVVAGVAPSKSTVDTLPPAASAIDAAARWITAYRAMDWRDGTSTAWIDRVQPYVSDAQHAQDEALRDGPTGADWADFVRKQCTSTAHNVDAVIPPESPGTTDATNVQVAATITTTCDAAEPDTPTEQTAATLVVTRAPDGTYRVDRRLF
jgi:hypothetical protein